MWRKQLGKMSKRADYESFSKDYDNHMTAAGADVMCALMQFYTGKPLKRLSILDAGCGTGNNTKALIEYGAEHITMIDASEGMLEVARKKLADSFASGSVERIVKVLMPPIPFPDATFDVVLFNFVLYHLDNAEGQDFPKCKKTLREARRVLRPNGVILITTLLKSTCVRTWPVMLDKTLGERSHNHFFSVEQFEEIFDATGIACMQKMNILGSDIYPNYFINPEILLELYFHYVNASDTERSTVNKKVAELKEKGELQAWIKNHDVANTSGLLTLLVCKDTKNQ